MHPRYFAIGGLFEDIPPAFEAECRKLDRTIYQGVLINMPDPLTENAIWKDACN